jgi:hypothetical protein
MIKMKAIKLVPASKHAKKYRQLVKLMMIGKQKIGEVYRYNYLKPKIFSAYSTDAAVQVWATGRTLDNAFAKFKLELQRAVDRNLRRLKYYMEKE